MTELHYGDSSSFQLSLRDQDEWLRPCRYPKIRNIENEVYYSLEHPLDFPPMATAIVPGDQIAVALSDGVPQWETVLTGVVDWMLQHGVVPEQVRIVMSNSAPELIQKCQELLRRLGASGIPIVPFDNADKNGLAYLGADEQADPVYICRELFDADVVIPIVCLRGEQFFNSGGATGIVPWFVDKGTLKRWQLDRRVHLDFGSGLDSLSSSGPESGSGSGSGTSSGSDNAGRGQVSAANAIGQQVGVYCSVGIVPGPGDSIIAVYCGDPQNIERETARLLKEAWPVPEKANFDLIVTSIVGSAEYQTWENVVRSIASAGRVLAKSGAIVVCSELSAEPGRALRQLSSLDSEESISRRIERMEQADAAVAMALLELKNSCRIYMKSELSNDVIEDLGLSTLESSHDLQNLLTRSQRCLIIESADHHTWIP